MYRKEVAAAEFTLHYGYYLTLSLIH